MAEAEFGVTYDGPALADGRMPVRDLAPALLALGDLFAEASQVLHPDLPAAAIDVRATREGSFDIHLILTAPESAWNQIVQLFGSQGATALANMQELVIGGVGLFALIKKIRGRRVTKQEPLDSGQVRLTLEDGDSIEIPSETLSLYRNVRIRRTARAVVEPVRRSGVERLDFRTEEEVTLSVEATEVEAFEVPDVEEEPLIDDTREMALAIASVSFTEGLKWRLSDGEQTFYVTVEDDGFLDRVDKGIEAFRKGDILRCRIRVEQTKREGKLHTEYHLVEMLEHIPSGEQLELAQPADDAAA